VVFSSNASCTVFGCPSLTFCGHPQREEFKANEEEFWQMNQACSQDFSKEGGKEYDMDPPARLSLEEENDALNIYWEALTFFYPMMGDIH